MICTPEDTLNFKYPIINTSGLNMDYSIGAVIEKCNNNSVLTKLFGKCGEEKDLDDYLTDNYGINFNILTNEISPTDYGNQIYNFIYGVSSPMKRKKTIQNNLIMSPLKIDINGGVVFPTRQQNQTYSFYENYVVEEERNINSNVLSVYNFCLSQSGYVFKSTYMTIYDSFPKIGGIIQLIYYIFFGINFMLNRFTIIDDAKKLFFTLHNDEAVNGGVQIKNFTNIASWKNFTALLLMDEEQQTAVLQGYGYTALQPMWGYRRYSNTQDELPSYMLGQHLLMCDTGEVRCVVSLNLHALADAVRALKEELRSNYIGEMPDEDGYRIDIYALRWQGKDYEVYITNRPMYFDVVVKELRLRRIIFFRNRLESLPIYPSATS